MGRDLSPGKAGGRSRFTHREAEGMKRKTLLRQLIMLKGLLQKKDKNKKGDGEAARAGSRASAEMLTSPSASKMQQ